jgi:hypothetical protein
MLSSSNPTTSPTHTANPGCPPSPSSPSPHPATITTCGSSCGLLGASTAHCHAAREDHRLSFLIRPLGRTPTPASFRIAAAGPFRRRSPGGGEGIPNTTTATTAVANIIVTAAPLSLKTIRYA